MSIPYKTYIKSITKIKKLFTKLPNSNQTVFLQNFQTAIEHTELFLSCPLMFKYELISSSLGHHRQHKGCVLELFDTV